MKIIPPQKLWQWDINKKVYISGITDADEWQVHFATDDDCTALVLPIKHDDSGYWAYIPNQLVSEGRLLLCYLYNRVEDWARTETMIKIPVQRRPKPAGYTLVLTDIETRGSLREDMGNLSSLTTQTQNSLVDAINEVNSKKHNDLYGRDAADVHPMSSITGLEQKFQSIDSVGTGQAKAIAQLKQDIETIEATDTSQSKAISSMQQSISSIQSASESNAAAISDMQVSISSINDVDYIQSQAIADAQNDIMRLIDQDTELSQDIAALENADSTLSQSISSLASSVDSAFAEVETALNSKQPVGNYVTSVNGTTPDKNGNINIDVQTYTAGEGISINGGAISVTNPMDDEQVSAGTTWSSAKIISSVSQSFSQSGSIITCHPVEGSPLHVVSDITAVQAGTGDPSPENIRPISGWDSAKLTRCGKNLIKLPYYSGNTTQDGVTVTVSDDGTAKLVGTTTKGYNYYLDRDIIGKQGKYIFQYYGNLLPVNSKMMLYDMSNMAVVCELINNQSYTFETKLQSRWITYINCATVGTTFNVSIQPILAVDTGEYYYEPYRGQTYTVDFPETVYGGTLDWATGVLTVTHKLVDMSTVSWNFNTTIWGKPIFYRIFEDKLIGNNELLSPIYKWASKLIDPVQLSLYEMIGYNTNKNIYIYDDRYATADEFRTAMTGIPLIYALATPYTIQLTPAQILAISGTNTVCCDTGDVTVSGYEDPRHTVAQLTSRIAALESAATGI